jgi:hypothetical protein
MARCPKGWQIGKSVCVISEGRDGAASAKPYRSEVPARKASKHNLHVTVPETDTGRRGEYPQTRVRTLLKELGKLAP